MALPPDNSSASAIPPDRQLTPMPVTTKVLTPAAERALAEAARRRAEIDGKANELARQREINGRGGLEPVRYDDWEVKGIASDF
ncbi:hypothetical protein FHS81_000897 [Pseudochelatococcus contaminans]|uniref:DUF1674 domain-containing protein n=2 Tax=Pseudochelatococcus contaminans TaxID=1538103 RepID=A0A7W5Z2E6_9HYPH|nr:hypothetical protein [Pseudochelatococcus contaminans]